MYKISKKKQEELNKLSKPLIKFINDNCNPHCTVAIDSTGYSFYSGPDFSFQTTKFIKD